MSVLFLFIACLLPAYLLPALQRDFLADIFRALIPAIT